MTRAAAIAVLALAATSACRAQRAPAPLEFGGEFSLTDQNSRTFHLHDVRGRPAVLFFGYTSCPDMCPLTMSRIAGALSRVGRSSQDVSTLFVSVDPKRDTPAVLKAYVQSFSIPLIALTGTADEVQRVAAAYHATHQVVPTGTTNYLVNHPSAVFLIDRRGRLREIVKNDETLETLTSGLRALLDETS